MICIQISLMSNCMRKIFLLKYLFFRRNLDNKSSVSMEDRNKSEIQNEDPLKT